MNVVDLTADVALLEREYANLVVSELQHVSIMLDKTLVLATEMTKQPPAGDNVVVLWLSDERRVIPACCGRVLAVFMAHLPPDRNTRPGNLFKLPLGVPNDYGFHAGPPLGERSVDVFFSGAVRDNTSRDTMLRRMRLAASHHDWKMVVEATGTHFHEGGLRGAAYRRAMDDSKIALCPIGVVENNPVTFRFYEAAVSGCAVLASENMPEFYHVAPYAHVRDDWSNAEEKIDYLLTHPGALELCGVGMRKWYERVVAPRRCASSIAANVFLLTESRVRR